MIATVLLLSFFLVASFILNVVSFYFLYKFSKIIMTFEDDIADVTSALSEVANSMKKVTEIQMFYEDDTIKNVVGEVLDSVKIAQFYISLMTKRFTDRSKQRYETVEPTEEEIRMALESPVEESEEGTVLHVGRPR